MSKNEKILIVDDDENICKTLSLILEKKNYSVDVAHTGKEATELMKHGPVNIVLLDIRLPDMEGIALMSTWRKKYQETDIIVITGNSTVDYAVKAVNQGAFAFLI